MTTATAGPTVRPAERDALERALTLAATDGVALGTNPRVGCVLLDADGVTLAEGFHRGAGTPHAEVVALTNARYAVGEDAVRGATAVVTLEPCAHTGRTGPCADALVEAGVGRVVFARRDPNPVAAGGAATLRAAGVDVVDAADLLDADLAARVDDLNRVWNAAVRLGRPYVTWKTAATLDGRTAAADGSSRWITSTAARRDAHRLRAAVDTVLVGTGTVADDDPALTVRGVPGPQPLRAAMGLRDVPTTSRLAAPGPDGVPGVHLRTRDPRAALAELWDADRRHVLVEGGATLAAAFWRAGLVDEVVAYIAPVLLGTGAPAVADLGITSIADAVRLDVVDVALLAPDPDDGPAETTVRLTLRPRKEQ